MVLKQSSRIFILIFSALFICELSSFINNEKEDKNRNRDAKNIFYSSLKEDYTIITNINDIYYTFKKKNVLLIHYFSQIYTAKSTSFVLQNEKLFKAYKCKINIFICIFSSINSTLFVVLNCFNVTKYSDIIVLKLGSSLYKWSNEILVFLLLSLVLLYLLYKNSRIKVYSKAKYLQQKKYIDAERQRISSEMHDEIGAGLSAIKLFSEMAARNRKDVDEIKEINLMVNDIADKINEIIWSTNADSDNLESLFDFIDSQSRKLFEHSNITFTANLPFNIPEGIVASQIRRNNYLLIKEIMHNALKHSQATAVHLSIIINNELILYNIKDNGIGFDPNKTKINSMGLSNLKLRIEKLKGSFIIENYKGTGILIKIPLSQIFSSEKKKKKIFFY